MKEVPRGFPKFNFNIFLFLSRSLPLLIFKNKNLNDNLILINYIIKKKAANAAFIKILFIVYRESPKTGSFQNKPR